MAMKGGLPPRIRTARLVLRRQRPEDAPLVKDAVDSSLAHLRTSVAWAQGPPPPVSTLASRLADSAAAFDTGEAWTFTVFDREETRVLGAVALEPADASVSALVGRNAAETGYWLRADSLGQGYATEATACLIELAFTHLGVERVVVCHDPTNAPSAGVPRRLGFRLLGTVSDARLPGRQAADGSVRPETTVWVLDGKPLRTSDEDLLSSRGDR